MIINTQTWNNHEMLNAIQGLDVNYLMYFYNVPSVQVLVTQAGLSEDNVEGFVKVLLVSCFLAENPSDVYYSVSSLFNVEHMAQSLINFRANDWNYLDKPLNGQN